MLSENEKFKKVVSGKKGCEIWYGDKLVARMGVRAGTGFGEIKDKELYSEYKKWNHEKTIEKLLEEEKYPAISEELILMGLPSGKPFNNLGNHPLWNNYVKWYQEFQSTC